MRKPTTRQIVWDRCGGCCEVCGRTMDFHDWALHHRKLRKHAGPDTPSNALAVHHVCHNLGTGSIHLAVAHALDNGWLVPSWADPATTTVLVAGRGLVLLDDTGVYVEEEAA